MKEHPRVHVNRQTVSLSFESSLIQSVMNPLAPQELVLDYTRTMMGFLLLRPAPARAAMVGLGGGSMVKFMHQHVPSAHLTVVEINPEVIALRSHFHVPEDGERLQTVCGDGAAWLKAPPHPLDVLLIDGFTGDGIPEALCSRSFFERCRAALAPGGVLVMNVQADTLQTLNLLNRLRKVFQSSVLVVESDEGGNDIMFAAAPAVLAEAAQAFSARWNALTPAQRDTLAVASSRIERALLRLPAAHRQPPPRPSPSP